MDALARVHLAAGPLLHCVDDALARCGAPADHPLWPLLRTGGLLPSDAVAAVAAWSPAALSDRATLLRSQASQQQTLLDQLSAPTSWQGQAAAAFHTRRDSAATRLACAHTHSLALAAHLDLLAECHLTGRLRLARVLAETLRSAEAVTLTLGPSADPTAFARAAATVATTVLSEVDSYWQAALTLHADLVLDDVSVPLTITATTSLRVDL
jgi:hypothetical protein